jgi:hypothetical protein
MAILTFRSIIIDLVGDPYFPIQRQTNYPEYTTLHFVNLGSAARPEFELHQGQRPAYRLSPEENTKLLRLMHGMTLSAPQAPMLALDGMATDLSIRQHGCDLSFRWHCQLPVEWDSLGELVSFLTSFQEEGGRL